MNKAFFLFLLPILFLTAGCTSHTMNLYGEQIEILSPEEEVELICTARATLAKSKRLSPADQKFIRENKPVFKIRYVASRTGDATISWKLPKKQITLLVRGTFFDGSAQWVLKVNNDQPAVLNFRKRPTTQMEKR